MAKCGACGKFLSQTTDSVKCDKCNGIYHRACVGLPTKGVLNVPWHCPECKRNQARDNRTDTPVRGSLQCSDPLAGGLDGGVARQSITDIGVQLSKFKEELIAEVRAEFKAFREDLLELRASLKSCDERLCNLEKRVEELEKNPVQHELSSDTGDTIAELKRELNERDQELLLNDIEIANVPEASGENPVHTALLIANKLGVNIETRDVVSAERVGRRIDATQSGSPRPARPRALLVRLARRATRDELLRSARVRRGATSADLQLPGPPKRFYVNERLTKQNRLLFRSARECAKNRGWRFVWTKKGRIYVRNEAGDSACPIRCTADLQRVFGSETPSN